MEKEMPTSKNKNRKKKKMKYETPRLARIDGVGVAFGFCADGSMATPDAGPCASGGFGSPNLY